MRILTLVLVCASHVVACSQADRADNASEPRSRVTVDTSLAAQGVNAQVLPLSGYIHNASNSHFALGTGATIVSEYGMSKLVGSQGVFATNVSTQMVLAIPNADSPARTGSALLDETTHNATVRSYFVGAGLPEAQILSVTAEAGGLAGGPGAGASVALRGTPPLHHFFSIIKRQANGVEVPDSYAWARFNTDGEVVHESVFWPEIPGSALADAAALQAAMNDPQSQAAYIASLPSETWGGKVVIHHTSGVWSGAFGAFASYDVFDPGGRPRHFDAGGTEFRLPVEMQATPPQPSKKR